jgi:hypothetical protein
MTCRQQEIRGKLLLKTKIAVFAMVLAIQCNENVRKWLVFILTHGDSAILCQSYNTSNVD